MSRSIVKKQEEPWLQMIPIQIQLKILWKLLCMKLFVLVVLEHLHLIKNILCLNPKDVSRFIVIRKTRIVFIGKYPSKIKKLFSSEILHFSIELNIIKLETFETFWKTFENSMKTEKPQSNIQNYWENLWFGPKIKNFTSSEILLLIRKYNF